MNWFPCLSSYWVARMMKEKNKHLLEKFGFQINIRLLLSSSWLLISCSGKEIGLWKKMLTWKNYLSFIKINFWWVVKCTLIAWMPNLKLKSWMDSIIRIVIQVERTIGLAGAHGLSALGLFILGSFFCWH